MEQSKFYQIKNITEHEYTLVGCDGSVITRPIQDVDKSASAFTIKDAKDGDVLVDEDNNIGIFEGIEGMCWHSYIYLGCNNRLYGFNIGGSHIQNNTKPATKEQRDTLIKAMTDAGWEFDFEKKELKKIEQKSQRMVSAEAKEALYDKLAWSEEDKKMIGRIMSIVEKYAFSQSAVDVNGDLCEKEYIDTDNWLKSLKDRVQPQPKQEWSEEDEDYYDAIITKLEVTQDDAALTDNQMEFLKSLKDRVQPQPKQEWSEEDETKMRAALAFIKSEFPKKGNEEIMEDTIEWLKSRKTHKTWKPSKGQLECLGYAIDKAKKDYSPLANNRIYLTLKALKKELEKLTE